METPEASHPTAKLRRLDQDELRDLLDHDPDPKVIVDAQGRIVFTSLQVERVLGFKKEDLLGRPIHMLIPPRFHATHAGHLQQFFSQPSTRLVGPGVDLRALAQDGSEIPVEISLSSIGEGADRLVVASVRDVSARQKVLTEMLTLNEQLSRKTIALESVVKDLRVFAQTASHDLQAPLRQIRQFLGLVTRRCGDQLSDEGREYIGCASDSAQHLSEMVNNVLAYSRIGASEHSFSLVDLEPVVDGVLLAARLHIHESGAQITRGAMPVVLAEKSQVTQLFQNLIANALHYRSTESPAIHIEAKPEAGKWVLSVRDNGVGIDPAYHERIFEMFKRASADPLRPGTGVGLAICKRVVERHDGRIWVDSSPGAGATFSFTLPATPGLNGEHAPTTPVATAA